MIPNRCDPASRDTSKLRIPMPCCIQIMGDGNTGDGVSATGVGCGGGLLSFRRFLARTGISSNMAFAGCDICLFLMGGNA